MSPISFPQIYGKLLKEFGPQGWWPINGKYYPGDFSIPRNGRERFEICVGAILTQNSSWKNVEKALNELKREKLLSPSAIRKIPAKKLAKIIHSSRYHSQKARKLKIFSAFFLGLRERTPSRQELLALWGIGNETADSMLLYAYKQPYFVVDSYTKRVLAFYGICSEKIGYMEIQKMFHEQLPRDFRLYNEFHALIVEKAKQLAKLGKPGRAKNK